MDFDRDQLLSDVFQAATEKLRDSGAPHTDRELDLALKEAMRETVEQATMALTGTVRSQRAALHGMLEEWDKTRKTVKTRWGKV